MVCVAEDVFTKFTRLRHRHLISHGPAGHQLGCVLLGREPALSSREHDIESVFLSNASINAANSFESSGKDRVCTAVQQRARGLRDFICETNASA